MTFISYIDKPSPNFGERPKGTIIDSIVIHYTAKSSVEEVIDVFQDPKTELSSHYTICREGTIYRHVCPSKRAWHAGQSQFGCRTDFNNFSLGIELYNPGHTRGYIPYTDVQITSLLALVRSLYKKFPINPQLVLGHSDIAPNRKQDPGELFPWEKFTREGLAIRPHKSDHTCLKIG